MQSDGKIIAGGAFTTYNTTTTSNRIARLNSTGTLDIIGIPVTPSPSTYIWRRNGAGIGGTTNTLTVMLNGSYTASTTVGGLTATSDPVIVALPPITVTTASSILPGIYESITVSSGGIAQLIDSLTVLNDVVVQDGGTLQLGPYRILPVTGGTSSFRLEAGATLSTGHLGGITQSITDNTGAVKLRGSRLFSPDASYVYTAASTLITSSANAVQFTGNGLPTRVRNLTDSTGVSVLNTGSGPGPGPITLKLSAPTSVTRVLKMVSAIGGNFDLNNQRLVLLSNSAGTALVVNTLGSGVVLGKATVQRSINPVSTPSNPTPYSGTGYRYYSSPVTGNMTVDSLRTTTFTPVVTPASANVFTYDQSRPGSGAPFDDGLTPPAALTTPLEVGKGYAVKLAATEMLSFRGTLTTGPQPSTPLVRSAPVSPLADNRGWNLVGNPYPSPIDWSLAAPADLADVGGAIYVYESTGPNAGFYLPYVSGVGRSPVLAAGQSFFVRVLKGLPTGTRTVRFSDAQRVTRYNDTATFSRQTPLYEVSIALALANRNGGSSTSRPPVVVHQNINAILGPGYSPMTDAYLIPTNTGTTAQALNVSVTAPDPNEELTVKGIQSFSNGTRIPLTLRAPGAGAYKLAVNIRVPNGVTVFLDDTLLVHRSLASLNPKDSISFTLTAQEAVQSTGRFSLRFVKTPLPVELTAFAVARRSPTAALLTWTTASEKANAYFEVETSTDGTAFHRLGQVPGQGTSGKAHNYTFPDEDLVRYAAPVVYYRLRQVDTDGTGSYSPVRSLSLADLGGAPIKLAAYPQPASCLLHVLGATPGAMFVLDDLLGRRMYTAPAPASTTADLLLPAALPAGTYLLRSGSRVLRIVLQ